MASTTKCCKCDHRIARDCTRCPSCGSTNPHQYALSDPRTIAAFVVIGIIILGCAGAFN